MRFGVWISSGHSWPEILRLANEVEQQGWDGIWLPDHLMLPEDGYGDPSLTDPELVPVHEAWSLLTGLAALVPRVTMGVLVSAVAFRHPAILAKMIATIDHISEGRTILGLGAGWQENEHRRYGLDLLEPKQRSDRLEEAAAVMSVLLGSEPRSDFAGDFYRLEGAPLQPRPIQDPYPLLIGGRGERRTMRTAARYASHWNSWGTPEIMRQRIGVLADRCSEIGRNPESISVSTNAILEVHDEPDTAEASRTQWGERGGLVGTPEQILDQVSAYADAGVDEIVVAGFNHSVTEFPEALLQLRRMLS